MLTKNLTPFFSGTKLCSRHPPQPEMTVVVRGTFSLAPGAVEVIEGIDQGFLSGDVFRDDDDEQVGECLYGSDFADFKLNAEVLLRGSCFTPGGKALPECPVRFAVGEWHKTLRVVGQRAWSDEMRGAQMSEPVPFSTMPIGYDHAFGGDGFDANPAGKGLGTELPNVESAEEQVRGRGDRPAPAGFGPINPRWPTRASKVGSDYGAKYQKERAPYYSADFDWSYFSAAPVDQQLEGYLRGDEAVVLNNLHPEHSVLETKLPATRVRVFVKDQTGAHREVDMRLDTLFVDTDESKLYLTWRGVTEVVEDDFADVVGMLIASEALGEEPKSAAHYRDELEAFLADPTGVGAALPQSLVELADRKGGEVPPEHARATADDDALTRELDKRFGGLMPDEELDEVREKVAATKRSDGSGLDLDEAVAKASQEIDDEPPLLRSIKPGVLPDMRLRDRMREVMAEVERLETFQKKNEVTVKGLDELRALPHDPKWKELDPKYEPPGPLPTDEPGPGANLAERDFTRADLRGCDLKGANLAGAILTQADLAGCELQGANLAGAILYKTNLEGAQLGGADLTRVNAAMVRATEADFRGANLEMAFFEEAELMRAVLDEVHGEYVIFDLANLEGATVQKAKLERCHFSEANLTGAKMMGAVLPGCLFAEARGDGLDLSEADLQGTSFADASLEGARLFGANAARTFWLRAKLTGANFGWVVAQKAHFTEAVADGASFEGANLRESRFYRASLAHAKLMRCNLFSADMRKTRAEGASFQGANLYDAKFLGSYGKNADFDGANLKRSTLEDA